MADVPASRLLGMRAGYLGLALMILFFQVVPLQTVPRVWAAPDMILALTFAWALRRPEYVPPVLVAAVFLFADLLLHRPPGLFAACVVLATEALKRRAGRVRNQGIASEAALVILMVVAATLSARIVMAVLLVPLPPLGLTAFQIVTTVLAYPLVVLISSVVFGVHARTPGDEATGMTRL